MYKKLIAASFLSALAFGMSSEAYSATCVGTCGEATAADGIVNLSPNGGSYRYISTNNGVTAGGIISSVGDGSGDNTGSSYTTTQFNSGAGDVLEFYFNYITSDGAGFSDYAWAQLQTSTGQHVAWLFTGRTAQSGNTSPGLGLPANDSTLNPSTSAIVPGGPNWSPLGSSSTLCFSSGCGYTGWIQSTYTIASAGLYQLVFGVQNWDDSAYASGLAFDGATIGGIVIEPGPGENPTTDVPLPGAALLLGTAVSGLYFGSRRRRRNR